MRRTVQTLSDTVEEPSCPVCGILLSRCEDSDCAICKEEAIVQEQFQGLFSFADDQACSADRAEKIADKAGQSGLAKMWRRVVNTMDAVQDAAYDEMNTWHVFPEESGHE